MTPIDPLATAAMVAAILDELEISYVIGGSVASSLHGEPRSTYDVDIMIDATEEKVRELVARLSEHFYADESDAVAAVREAGSFNAIHSESSLKVDFFIAEPLGRRQIERRRAVRIRADLPPLCFYSPEDLVIRKLLWFRLGGESSDRQWRDVVSLLKAQVATLDTGYLDAAAEAEGIAGLLRRARNDAEG